MIRVTHRIGDHEIVYETDTVEEMRMLTNHQDSKTTPFVSVDQSFQLDNVHVDAVGNMVAQISGHGRTYMAYL